MALLYAGALSLLFLAAFYQSLPWPVFFAAGWWLADEWQRRCCDINRAAGRLRISEQGVIDWQGQRWRLHTARIRTSQLLVWRLEGHAGYRWLAISPDACTDTAYRSLSLYSHHHRAFDG